jgi:hypothetical protein
MFKQTLLIAALLLVATEIYAQNVTIRGARLTGNGCNNSSASAAVTEDGQTLSILFDNYQADIGIGSSNPQALQVNKDCHVLIDVDVPAGYQYAIVRTEYRGFAALPASAYGYHRFTQIIPGVGMPPSMREAQLRGPIASNYEVAVDQKPGREVYSTCNKPQQTIDLLSELFVGFLPKSTGRTMAAINLDSIDTGVQSRFKLRWRPCK